MTSDRFMDEHTITQSGPDRSLITGPRSTLLPLVALHGIMVSGSAGGRMTAQVRLDVNRRARVDQRAMPRSSGACRRRGMCARIRQG